MLRYRFFDLFSGSCDDSVEKSKFIDSSWIISYSLLKPISPSTCKLATCLEKPSTVTTWDSSLCFHQSEFGNVGTVCDRNGGSSK